MSQTCYFLNINVNSVKWLFLLANGKITIMIYALFGMYKISFVIDRMEQSMILFVKSGAKLKTKMLYGGLDNEV